MRILGVDPGLISTGYGIVQTVGTACKLIEAGVIRTDDKQPLPLRILRIHEELRQVLVEFSPDAMAVEDLYTHYSHPATATLMGHARGVVLLAAAQAGIDVVSYSPTRIKKAITGSGKAAKLQVQNMVQVMLGLSKAAQPDHLTDALAAAICHANAVSRSDLLRRLPSKSTSV